MAAANQHNDELVKASQIIADALAKINNPATSEGERLALMDSLSPESKVLPKGWGKYTVAPYYRESFALELKKVLDEMILDIAEKKTDQFYGQERFHRSRRTLYVMLNQAWMYLNHHLDPDNRYKHLRKLVEVSKDKGGVRLQWIRPNKNSILNNKPLAVQPKMRTPDWKAKLEEFVDTAQENQKFELKDNISLSDADLNMVRNSFMGVIGFHVLKLESTWIKIIKNTKMIRPIT